MGFLLRILLFRFLFRGRIGWVTMLVLMALFAGGQNYFSKASKDAPTSALDIPAHMRACTRNTQCVLIDARCDGCCTYDAINAAATEAYTDLRRGQCASHPGPVCDCMTPQQPVPVCRNRRCAVDWQPRK